MILTLKFLFRAILFGSLCVSVSSQSLAADLNQIGKNLSDRTYRFGLKQMPPAIAYLAPNGRIAYSSGMFGIQSIQGGRWKVLESKGSVVICIKMSGSHCYPAKRFRRFLTDWSGNPLGLRVGLRLNRKLAYHHGYVHVKNALGRD